MAESNKGGIDTDGESGSNEAKRIEEEVISRYVRVALATINAAKPPSLVTLLEEADSDDQCVEKVSQPLWKSQTTDRLKASVNTPSKELQESPLHIAIRKRFRRTINWLLKAGADIHAVNKKKLEPLHYACIYSPMDDTEVVLQFSALIKGTDTKVGCDLRQRNPLHHAIRQGLQDEKTIESLCKVTGINDKALPYERTPLNLAVCRRNYNVVRTLLKVGADIAIPDSDGWTPLISSIMVGAYDISKALLFHMKNDYYRRKVIHVQDQEGVTALMRLCACHPSREEFFEKVKDLAIQILELKEGNIGDADKEGRTALHYAMGFTVSSNVEDSKRQIIAYRLIKEMPEEALLRQDKNRKTAFDDAFRNEKADAFQRLFMLMLSRLVEKKRMRHSLFRWLARREERHKFAKEGLWKLSTDGKLTKPAKPEDWTLIKWAIHHQLPGILLSLSEIPRDGKNFETSDAAIEEGMNLLKSPDQHSCQQSDLQGGNATDDERMNGEAEGAPILDDNYHLDVVSVMQNLLDLLGTKRRERYKEARTISPPSEPKEEMTKNFHAAIVEILPDNEDSSYSCVFRKVHEVLYDRERQRINTIREAVQEVHRLEMEPKEDAKENDHQTSDNGRNFVWIHLPSNNTDWMRDTMKKVTQQMDCSLDEFERVAAFLRTSGVELPDQTSPSRFMRPRYVKRDTEARRGKIEIVNETFSDGDNDNLVAPDSNKARDTVESSAVYMPFLSLSLHPQEDRKGMAAAPDTTSMRQKLFDVYEGSVQLSPTLDEYYHHFTPHEKSQSDRDMRNRDQIIAKHVSNQTGSPNEACALIRVSQLWIWTIGNKWIITSTSCAYSDTENDFVLGFLRYLDQRPDGATQGRGLKSPAELSTAIVNYCIESYERNDVRLPKDTISGELVEAGKSGVDRSIGQVFSDFINEIGRKEANLFQKFNDRIKEKPTEELSLTNRGERIKLTVKEWREAATEAAYLLLNIKDVRDELHILGTVAEHQQNVQLSMDNRPAKASEDVIRRELAATAVLKNVRELDNVAGRVYEAVNATITLHESEIANLQSEIAIIQTTETMSQGKTVMIFTAVTSIFLPLSFLTSLFALDVASFLEAPWWSLIVIFVVPLPFLAVGVDYVRGSHVSKYCLKPLVAFLVSGVDYVRIRGSQVTKYCLKPLVAFLVSGVDYVRIRGSQVTKCCLKALDYFIAFIRGTANLFKLVCFLLIFSRRTKKQAKKTWEPPTAE